jgi:hypothetical protein
MVVTMIWIPRIIALALGLWLGHAAYAQFGGGGSPCGAGDLNASCQVTGSHLAAPLPAAQGGSASASGLGVGATRVLCSIRAANFNVTTDQSCVLPAAVTVWAPTSIVVTNCSTSMTLAAGGVYPTTAKGGTALVAATQVYTALTTSSTMLGLTMAAGIATTRQTVGTVFLSLTTAQGGAATCDFYLIGNDLT